MPKLKAVIILRSDPTLNRCLDTELTFLKQYLINYDIFIYSKLKVRIVQRLKDLYQLTDSVNDADILISDMNDSNFFGGAASKTQYETYKIFSEHTNKGKKLYFRIPDSEMTFIDLKKSLKYKVEDRKKIDCLEHEYNRKIFELKTINYQNVYYLKNGIPKFKKWSFKQPKVIKVIEESLENKNSFYPGDNLIFNVENIKKQLNLKFNFEPIKRFVHVGIFKSVGVKKERLFKKPMFKFVDLYAMDRKTSEMACNVIDLDNYIIGKDYFQLLNKYLAYIFIAKGDLKAQLQYVNKTIYDCYIAKTPILIYQPIDKDRKLFGDLDCYFTTEEELEELKFKLSEFYIRSILVNKQEKIIKKYLKYENRKN